MPVPITRPPTVRSSNSGRIGIVHPSLSSVRLNWPIVTIGSHRTVLFKLENQFVLMFTVKRYCILCTINYFIKGHML